jgi:hypothetical protein
MRRMSLFLYVLWISTLLSCTVVYNQPSSSQTPPKTIQQESQIVEDWRPTNVAETVVACKRIQAADNIPIDCKFDYMDGKPMMVIGFTEVNTAKAYIEPMIEYVASPFCSSANTASRPAFLFFIVNSAFAGNLYSCEKAEATGWFNLERLYSF